MSAYQPPCTITPATVNLVAEISEAVGRLTVLTDQTKTLRLRRINQSNINATVMKNIKVPVPSLAEQK